MTKKQGVVKRRTPPFVSSLLILPNNILEVFPNAFVAVDGFGIFD